VVSTPDQPQPAAAAFPTGAAQQSWNVLSPSRGFSRRRRLTETLWELTGQPLLRLTFHNWYATRVLILRAFGAHIHPTARVRPSAHISHPWNLTIGAHTSIGDHAILDCLAPITIGRRCTISQYAYLCTTACDCTLQALPVTGEPITIEDDAWIAADVYVAPGVTVGADTVVGARSSVFKSMPPRSVCAGDNARKLGERAVRELDSAPSQRTSP